MSKHNIKILEKSIATHGQNALLVSTIEELSKLQQALCQYIACDKDNEKDVDDIKNIINEEAGNCSIMLTQLEMLDIINVLDMQLFIDIKEDRLKRRMEVAK